MKKAVVFVGSGAALATCAAADVARAHRAALAEAERLAAALSTL